MKPNVLKGHTLPWEGSVYVYGRRSNGEGLGRCSCGAHSPEPLRSTYARRQWHRQHKDEVRAAGDKP